MTQDEVKQLTDEELCSMSRSAASFWSTSPLEKIDLSTVAGKSWNPIRSTEQAMHLASLMNMNICFGDRVVLVSEPNAAQSRTVEYQLNHRIEAMRRAITLLAADSSQFI
ncbi:MAG: hypothetical protein KIB40_22475 [Pantoea sp.]|uniref:Uncharacterized protein n=1 Tax=Pantoea brenneri TaxID=472694 RepID=A0AAX3J480_9GAMM|nr:MULTISPECIES: hypothetical protein [Pantoea]MBS6035859.1 hypothetical protein [Pantoea sp.]MDH2124195.1 hypothetical protein [Pantoea brenneri]VXB57721.1 conserved hypothetical protein [Pantoea brenneri]